MTIPYGKHLITEADKAVMAVLDSDFLTQGPLVPRFESELSAISNVTCNSYE